MSSLYKQFQTNNDKEVQGIKVEYGKNDDGSVPTFIVSRMNRSNQRYSKELEREVRPVRRQIELDTLDNMVAEELQLRVFVRSVLMGWENVQGKDGKFLSFNEQNAFTLLHDLPDLYDDLSAQAKKASLFRDEQVESDAKN